MTESNVEGLAAKMNSLVTDTTCPACGGRSWTVHEHPLYQTAWDGENVDVAGGIAFIACCCNTCGFARFHNTYMLERA
jgi:hypothetical protein